VFYVDEKDRILWISDPHTEFTVAIGFDERVDVGYLPESGTLCIALEDVVGWFEMPCTQAQAEEACRQTGWEMSPAWMRPMKI
jgi:hypothetical protein